MYKDFKVLWVENKTTKTDKPYKKLSIEDEEGKKTDVNIFADFPDFANIIPGSSIRGKLEQNGQYWNIVSETQSKGRFGNKPNFDRIIEKKQAGIAESQDKKAQNIALAQDRSAWMWAKTNATTLLQGQVDGLDVDEMTNKVLDLATKIYNGEPTEPF